MDITTQLRLMWQHLTLRNEISKIASRAQLFGEEIFNIHIPFLLEGTYSQADCVNQLSALGNYDFNNDVTKIYIKRMKEYCRYYRLNFNSIFLHTFYHELGHAKEARSFESAGIFPYRRNTFHTCPMKLDSKYYNLTDFKIGGTNILDAFMSGTLDYAIEKELRKFEIENPASRRNFQNLQEGLQKMNLQNIRKESLSEEQYHTFFMNSLLFLPYYVSDYVWGSLNENEQYIIERYYRNILGNKWDLTLEIMSTLEFCNPEKYVNVIHKLFESILGLHVSMRTIQNRELFKQYKSIPRFWNKTNYKVIYIAPPQIGKKWEKLEFFESINNS